VDLLVEGRAYVDGRVVDAAIGVVDGVIAWLGKPSGAPQAYSRFRAGPDELVLPGMVDMHVHMRDLGESYKEDWYTGTLAALAGGVTFVGDMPNNKPPVRGADALSLKAEAARGKALVDYGFYAGLPEKADELDRMAEQGVLGLKLYPEDILSSCLVEALKRAARMGLRVVAHAEDPLYLRLAEGVWEKSLEQHGRLRPPEAEASAIRLLTWLALALGFDLHFTHVSSRQGLLSALKAKAALGATADTTIHHILLDEARMWELGGFAKVNPPLRSPGDRRAVKAAAAAGALDALVTDHAPHALSEKSSEKYEEVLPGFPGLELCLPLLFTEIAEGRLPLSALELYSRRPAAILGLPKGSLTVGNHADIVVVRRRSWVVSGAALRSKAKYTPFEGFRAAYAVARVYVRGELAYDEGEVKVSPGFGRRVG